VLAINKRRGMFDKTFRFGQQGDGTIRYRSHNDLVKQLEPWRDDDLDMLISMFHQLPVADIYELF